MSMNAVRASLIAGGAGLTLIALSAGLALALPDEGRAIADRLSQYQERFNAGDAEALAQLFSEDVIYYGPLGEVFEGRDAVEQRYRNNLEMGLSDMAIETLEIRVLGDTAYDIARYTVSAPDGTPLTGYHLAILEREDGDWVVQRTLVNAVMPPPPTQ